MRKSVRMCDEVLRPIISYFCLVDPDEAPTGMMARGHYEAVSKFQDDDKHEYLKFEWSFDITKDWK